MEDCINEKSIISKADQLEILNDLDAKKFGGLKGLFFCGDPGNVSNVCYAYNDSLDVPIPDWFYIRYQEYIDKVHPEREKRHEPVLKQMVDSQDSIRQEIKQLEQQIEEKRKELKKTDLKLRECYLHAKHECLGERLSTLANGMDLFCHDKKYITMVLYILKQEREGIYFQDDKEEYDDLINNIERRLKNEK